MPPVATTVRDLAVLGVRPAFPLGNPVALIHPIGYYHRGDFGAVNAILGNTINQESNTCASQQRFVAKILPGVESSRSTFRAMLQDCIEDLLGLDTDKTSVVCVTSGTDTFEPF